MLNLNDFLNFREEMKGHMDAMVYGTGRVMTIERKRWNPLRYVLGIEKVKRLDPRKYFRAK